MQILILLFLIFHGVFSSGNEEDAIIKFRGTSISLSDSVILKNYESIFNGITNFRDPILSQERIPSDQINLFGIHSQMNIRNIKIIMQKPG